MLEKLYNLFRENEIDIDLDDFYYGAATLFNYLIFASIILLISMILRITFTVLIFLIAYIYLRQYTGGIHLSNSFLCTIASTLITIGIPIIVSEFSLDNICVLVIIPIINYFTLSIIKTMDHENKKLTEDEINFYTKKGKRIEMIYFFLCLLFFLLDFDIGVKGILAAESLCSLELLFLEIKHMIFNKN